MNLIANYSNLGFCSRKDYLRAEGLDESEIQGPQLTKDQWAARKIELVPFKIHGLKPNKLILVDKFLQDKFLRVKNQFHTQLAIAIGTTTLNKIIFTGYGIGGAYAALSGLTWRIESYLEDQETPDSLVKFSNFEVQVMTFGAPRLGNVVFAQLTNKFLKIYRVTHTNDHVPQFPSRKIGNHILEHHELELWIDSVSCACSPDAEYFLWECQGFKQISKSWNQIKISNETFFPDGGNSGENLECNSGQSIAKVLSNFIHTGPYFGVKMGYCE
ncbi:hypothetical protein G9A89_019670 [Geosiphon pyriformis]|nr:hypothetical protein G9A89_019670 [Geosiphon pyriformis]